jgi:hypothetical protein
MKDMCIRTQFHNLCLILMGRCSNSLRAEQSEDRIPAGTRLSHPPRPTLWPIQRPTQRVPVISRWGRQRSGVDHPPVTSAAVKERVELYIYSPSGPSRPVSEGSLFFILILIPSIFSSSR